MIRGGDVPTEWKTAYITNIYKKGDRKECTNYRPISVTNSVSRIYGKIIKMRLENAIKDVEEQNGFRAGRSCIDGIFCLRQIIDKRLAHNLETHMVFIDLTKAYDNVPLEKLWEVLRHQNINIQLITAIQNLYNDMTSCIKIGRKVTNPINISKVWDKDAV